MLPYDFYEIYIELAKFALSRHVDPKTNNVVQNLNLIKINKHMVSGQGFDED